MAIALQVSNNETPGLNNHLLNRWADFMMESPWQFNQCAGIGAPIQTGNDKAGIIYLQKEREYIARSLETALTRISQDLNYWATPQWFQETIPIGAGIPVQGQFFQARYCKTIALGTRAQTLIQAGVAVVYSDPNSVGVNDTATITVVTGVANAEIKLYFQVADGAPTAGDKRYEIEPLIITDSAGTVTIKGHRSLFVKPTEWAREYVANDPNFNSPNIVDTANASTGFVTAVDVYRVYNDTTAAIQLLAADGTVLQSYTGEIIDAELSAFRIGSICSAWNSACSGAPQRTVANYYAGSPLVNGNMDADLYEAVVGLACGNMMSQLGKMSYWTLDLWQKYHAPMVETSSGGIIPVASKQQSESMYGARYGQVYASGVVKDRRIFKGHKLTYNMGY